MDCAGRRGCLDSESFLSLSWRKARQTCWVSCGVVNHFQMWIFSLYLWWCFLSKSPQPPPTFSSFHCHAALLWWIHLLFLSYMCLFSKPLYKARFYIINVSVSLKAPRRSSYSATIKRNQFNVESREARTQSSSSFYSSPSHYKWRLQTCGMLILRWADSDVDQSGDEEAELSPRLLRMKRRSMQQGDIISKSFLPARIWAPSKTDTY